MASLDAGTPLRAGTRPRWPAAMGRMLALELTPARIRVNIICPGQIET
jgi:hypothetical protein